MRKIVARLFMSLDGVVGSPDRWVGPYFNEEIGEAVGAVGEVTDAMLLGRRTYEEWADYWPDKTAEDDPYAGFINDVQKFIVSTTLTTVGWRNSSLLSGDLAEALADLKEQPGTGIGISGSITLIGSLLRMGLLDELVLLVFPVVVGSGKRLFEVDEQVPLRLVDSKTFQGGVLSLTYERVQA
jgi:dihydrofolate reductase